MSPTSVQQFKEEAIHYFSLNFPRIQNCLSHLSEEELWHTPNESTNSVGNLLLHLCGNITQYILSGIGGAADERERDLEFSQKGNYTKKELADKIKEVLEASEAVIGSMTEEQLMQQYHLQGFELSGYSVVIHVVEHLSYHMGQIALLTKLMHNKDLDFYAGLDLNIHNENKGN